MFLKWALTWLVLHLRTPLALTFPGASGRADPRSFTLSMLRQKGPQLFLYWASQPQIFQVLLTVDMGGWGWERKRLPPWALQTLGLALQVCLLQNTLAACFLPKISHTQRDDQHLHLATVLLSYHVHIRYRF